MARASSPTGHATRGTTNTNRLRRVDRWIAARPELLRAPAPLVVDLGYGASGVTALELYTRLRTVAADVEVLGLEIDPDRVARATAQLEDVRAGRTPFPTDARVRFARGGFEVPTPRPPTIIRASNVLRQYDETEVADAWRLMTARLAPGGLLIEGTCDEIGRVSSWIDVSADAVPLRFTISLRLAGLEHPAIVAERLPKALIHRNIPGERVHDLMALLDTAWERNAALATFGPVQRWLAVVAAVRDAGWPVQTNRTRAKLGELTLPYSAVAPR
ncbi:class I SAM-dependent methyltransferase [Microbacterium gorillae]|uniref:class I SAM-dependent methyltransferase n=1 Tax=Microbacterium gorillae TaxID=1231063 RepID=UPI00058E74D6|nr:class I SAM-dependent methyltransferase [Microbacterium gorillae]